MKKSLEKYLGRRSGSTATHRQTRDPKLFAEQVQRRKDQGFTWFKMDIGTRHLAGIPGTLSQPAAATAGSRPGRPRRSRGTGGPGHAWAGG